MVDFLFAPSTPWTQREKQPGAGRWTKEAQTVAKPWRLHQWEEPTSRGREQSERSYYLHSVMLLRFSKRYDPLCKAFIVKEQKPSKTVHPREHISKQCYFPRASLGMHIATANKEGTKAPNDQDTTQTKMQQWSGEWQLSQKTLGPTTDTLLRPASRVGCMSTA